MKAQALDAGLFQRAVPGRPEFVRPAHLVAAGFAEEDQVGVDGAHRIVEREAQDRYRLSGQRDGAGRAVLGLREVDGAVVKIHLAARQALDLAGSHTGVERDAHDPAEHRVGVAVAGPQ